MKNTLGKMVLILLFFTSLLEANLASYKLTSNISKSYVKEAVEITFEAVQTNHDEVMFFFLEPKPSDDYKIILLNKDEKEISYHNTKTTFTFLLFGLKAKDIYVDFDYTIKVASDEAVAEVFTGSRDNVKWIETTNTQVKIPPLHLNVSKFNQSVDLVGDFTLVSKIDKESINAYESTNITYFLEGVGYDAFKINPIEKTDGIKIFSDITKHFNKATKDGYIIKREFNYALVSDKDMHIESKTLHCYSPKYKKYYTIKTEAYNIKVQSTRRKSLVDKENSPISVDYFSYLQDFFIYFIIFLSGYLSAILTPNRFINKEVKFKDIKNSTDAKELLYIVMHSYTQYNLNEFNNQLENIVYAKADKSKFSGIKKEILKRLEKLT